MNHRRRQTLKAGGGLGVLGLLALAGLIMPARVRAAWQREAFEANSIDAALAALGAGRPTDSADITLTVPDIAENGVVVRVGVASGLPGTEAIAILIDGNPSTLAALIALPAGTLPEVTTQVKMAQSAGVHALVKAGGRFYTVKKDVEVTVGGCAG
jgi:sulfur-oxidizing protein SoxY